MTGVSPEYATQVSPKSFVVKEKMGLDPVGPGAQHHDFDCGAFHGCLGRGQRAEGTISALRIGRRKRA